MKTSLFNILVILILIGVALPTVGGTLATWSDSETMAGNYIETGSLDLLVNGQDDLPWGIGLEPCFDIPEFELGVTYACYRLLWNAGCVDGVAYLHIKDVTDNLLASNTIMHIWYDHDGNPTTPVVLVKSGIIADLDCNEIELGPLPAEAERQLKLEIHADEGAPGDVLSFDIAFELIQVELLERGCGWADTEKCPNQLTLIFEGCTPGFWQGGFGSKLWNEPNDPDWTDAGGEGSNPFIHTKLFNDFFTSHSDLDDLTMMDLVGKGGGKNDVRKAARSLVAAYLNASFGMNYPLTPGELSSLWAAAVADGSDEAFMALHLELDEYNNYGCDLCD